MRWNSSKLISGMQNLFGSFAGQTSVRSESALDDIRHAMLDALGALGASSYPVVQLRVSYANEIQDLWYLRGDLMAVLAAIEGESVARSKLDHISEMFKGLLPQGMNSRFSPLSN